MALDTCGCLSSFIPAEENIGASRILSRGSSRPRVWKLDNVWRHRCDQSNHQTP